MLLRIINVIRALNKTSFRSSSKISSLILRMPGNVVKRLTCSATPRRSLRHKPIIVCRKIIPSFLHIEGQTEKMGKPISREAFYHRLCLKLFFAIINILIQGIWLSSRHLFILLPTRVQSDPQMDAGWAQAF